MSNRFSFPALKHLLYLPIETMSDLLPLDLGLRRSTRALRRIKVVVLLALAALLEVQTQSLLEIRWRWESLEPLALVCQSRFAHQTFSSTR